MKAKTTVFLTALFGLVALPSCQIKANDNYFVVTIYGDYVGMETDLEVLGHYDTNRAIKIGYCYALKDKPANLDAVRTYKKDGDQYFKVKESHRDPGHGYVYTFREYAGFYDDGTPIDTSKITADCALFSVYDHEKADFLVSVKDAFGNPYGDFNGLLPYQTKVGDIEGLKNALTPFPDHDVKGGLDPYYMEYAPKGWNVYVYKSEDQMTEEEKSAGKDVVIDDHGLRDDDDKPMTAFIEYDDVDAITNYLITNKTVFQASYAEGEKKSFTVSLSYQLRTLTSYDAYGKPIYSYGDFALAPSVASQEVVHGEGIDESALAVPNYRIVGIGQNGVVDVYPDTEDCPEVLRGYPIMRNKIKYHCHITLLYQEEEMATLRFHADLSDMTIVPANTSDDQYTQEVLKGDGAVIPPLLNTSAMGDYRFTGNWSMTPWDVATLDYEIFYTSVIHSAEEVDLYPIMMPKEITQGAYTFQFDLARNGYLLKNIDAAELTFDDADVLDATFPSRYPYIGVLSFGDTQENLTSVKLGSRASYIGHGELSLLHHVTLIDLKDSGITELPSYAFKNLIHLTEVRLGSKLEKVGTDLFSHCNNLSSISIDMTESQVAEKDFDALWHSGKTVTYKS